MHLCYQIYCKYTCIYHFISYTFVTNFT